MKTNLALLLRAPLLVLALMAVSTPVPSQVAGTKAYPLKVCVVSGNELGSMGRIVTKTHGDQEIKFCCKPCVKKFEKDPAKFLAKLK